jgi:hypothetical protein
MLRMKLLLESQNDLLTIILRKFLSSSLGYQASRIPVVSVLTMSTTVGTQLNSKSAPTNLLISLSTLTAFLSSTPPSTASRLWVPPCACHSCGLPKPQMTQLTWVDTTFAGQSCHIEVNWVRRR